MNGFDMSVNRGVYDPADPSVQLVPGGGNGGGIAPSVGVVAPGSVPTTSTVAGGNVGAGGGGNAANGASGPGGVANGSASAGGASGPGAPSTGSNGGGSTSGVAGPVSGAGDPSVPSAGSDSSVNDRQTSGHVSGSRAKGRGPAYAGRHQAVDSLSGPGAPSWSPLLKMSKLTVSDDSVVLDEALLPDLSSDPEPFSPDIEYHQQQLVDAQFNYRHLGPADPAYSRFLWEQHDRKGPDGMPSSLDSKQAAQQAQAQQQAQQAQAQQQVAQQQQAAQQQAQAQQAAQQQVAQQQQQQAAQQQAVQQQQQAVAAQQQQQAAQQQAVQHQQQAVAAQQQQQAAQQHAVQHQQAVAAAQQQQQQQQQQMSHQMPPHFMPGPMPAYGAMPPNGRQMMPGGGRFDYTATGMPDYPPPPPVDAYGIDYMASMQGAPPPGSYGAPHQFPGSASPMGIFGGLGGLHGMSGMHPGLGPMGGMSGMPPGMGPMGGMHPAMMGAPPGMPPGVSPSMMPMASVNPMMHQQHHLHQQMVGRPLGGSAGRSNLDSLMAAGHMGAGAGGGASHLGPMADAMAAAAAAAAAAAGGQSMVGGGPGSPGPGSAGQPICRYFATGYCSRGDQCNFAHISSRDQAFVKHDKQQPQHMAVPGAMPGVVGVGRGSRGGAPARGMNKRGGPRGSPGNVSAGVVGTPSPPMMVTKKTSPIVPPVDAASIEMSLGMCSFDSCH